MSAPITRISRRRLRRRAASSIRNPPTEPANYRAEQSLDAWLKSHRIIGLCGVDTRRLTRLIRDSGPPNGVIAYQPDGRLDLAAMCDEARAWPGLDGMDLARDVTCRQSYEWRQTAWRRGAGYGSQGTPRFHVVAVDYGTKHNILRMLAEHGCRVTVVPATATPEEIMRHQPDGIFLSNGPGDPAATAEYAVPVLRELIDSGTPMFGICFGHQLLSLALGGTTRKMDKGHRGANHPVRDSPDRQGRDHQPEPRLCRRSRQPAGRRSRRPIPRCSTAPTRGCASRTCRSSRCSTTPKPAPARRTAIYLFQRFVDSMAENSGKR